jgi:hypothetical protein
MTEQKLLDEVVNYLTKDGAVMELARAREAAALIRRLSRASAGGQWLPIESAPKDGTPVLTWGGDFPRVRRFLGGSWRNMETHQLARIQPTHYIPLPPPPPLEPK